MMLRDACLTVVRRASRTDPSPEAWRQAATAGRVEMAPRIQRLRQLTMRDSASLSFSHPPTGLRARLVESRGQQTASVVLTRSESAQIDQELAARYRELRTQLTTVM
jgi:heat shock protein HtpX